MVNCQLLCVVHGIRTQPFVIPNPSSCHSERSEESRPGKEKRFIAYALNDKVIVNGQLSMVMPCRGEPCVRPFFVWCRAIRTQISQMGANGRSTYHVPGMTIDN